MERSLLTSLAVASALGLAACGGGDTTVITSVVSEPTSSTAPTTTVTTTTTSSTGTSTPEPTLHLASFRSPSGNIGCLTTAGTVRCDIQKRSWNPPRRPADCPSEVDFGQGITVGSGAARFVCAGDTALNPAATKLAYGTATATGDLTCASATAGMTCTNESTGHGFVISSASYRLF